MRNNNKNLKNLKKVSGMLALVTFLTANISIITFANTQNDFKTSENPYATKINSNNNTITKGIEKKYTFECLNRLSYENLVNLFKNIKPNQIDGLFKFSKESYEFFNNKDRVQAIINELCNSGKSYTYNDTKGIPTLVEVLRSGFYLGYYNKELSYLNDINFKNKCIPAIKAIENNSYFGFGTGVQDNVVGALGRLIGNTSIDAEGINGTIKVFDQFYSNFKIYSNDNKKGSALYDLMNGIDYFTNVVALKNKDNIKNTSFYGNIDSYILRLDWFSLARDYMTNSNQWLFNNSIYFDSRLSIFRSNPKFTQQVLTKATETYPYLGTQYFQAINGLINYFNGIDYNGHKIDLTKIKEKGREKYLPKTYKFDDGDITVRAGDKVKPEKIQRLYWASKEVKAQFLRVLGKNSPIDKDRPEEKLNIVIYNSPSEYKMNEKLYGYSTDNGGIYIEPVQTFFTYERTPEESIYTLEELFRHEFTHYLQGKYIVPGIWGQGPFYIPKDKLTWYDEGTAEFFAGSTRTQNILPRKSIVSNLAPNINNRMNLNKLFQIQYGTWSFYNYGCAFASYMYNNNLEMLQYMNKLIEDNNANDFTKYINDICKDKKVEQNYQNYISSLIEQYPNLNVPLVSDFYTEKHPYKNPSEVYNRIKEVTNIKNIKTKEEESEYFKTFDLDGTYEGDKSLGQSQDWKTMNKKVNEILSALSKESWNGYKTITAYFTNYKVKDGKYTFDVSFHGILNDKNKICETEPNNAFQNANSITEPNTPINCSILNNNDSDVFSFDVTKDGPVSIKLDNPNNIGLNYLVFKDNDLKNYVYYPNVTNNSNIEGKFNATKGRYYVKVYKSNVNTNNGNYKININGSLLQCKSLKAINGKQDNNTVDKAMKINLNAKINSYLSYKNNTQIYEIDINKNCDLNIDIENFSNTQINWTLYNSKDMNKYISYANINGNNLSNNYKAEKGKYYLYVYKTSSGEANYNLEINN